VTELYGDFTVTCCTPQVDPKEIFTLLFFLILGSTDESRSDVAAELDSLMSKKELNSLNSSDC
jgi:hypothetical protein